MGYTHYWQRRRALPLSPFLAAVEDCRRLCSTLPIPLGDGQGRNQPIFSRCQICFNGRVSNPNDDGSCETFLIERISSRSSADPEAGDWCFGFCKTEHRPYDLLVQGCLIILNHRLGSEQFRVESDGSSPQWDDARAACQRVLGYGRNWGEGKLAPVPPAERANPSA